MRSEAHVELYKRYSDSESQLGMSIDPVKYPSEWLKLQEQYPFEWFPYVEMAQDYSREVANSVNELMVKQMKLVAWSSVIDDLPAQEKYEAIDEFVEPLATVALNLPYVIKYRFIYSATKLSHQANRARLGQAWKDRFVDESKLNLSHFDQFCGEWSCGPSLKSKIRKISAEDYCLATKNFRNLYHHRVPPRIEIGITNTVSRAEGEGGVTYGFGGMEPLRVVEVSSALSEQILLCRDAYEQYKALICEHLNCIHAA